MQRPEKDIEKKWVRLCPECEKDIKYTLRWSLVRANKNNSLCKRCSQIGRIFTDEHKMKIKYKRKFQSISDKTRVKMSQSHLGHLTPKAVIEKIKKSNLGQKRTEETKRNISKAKKGSVPWNKGLSNDIRLKHTNESIKKIRISTIKNIENRVGQLSPNYNPSSIPVLEQKASELGITDLQHAENGGEFHIKELGYWVDGYSKDKNVIIEYYEPFHEKQKERDELRKREIENLLGCTFIEIKE